jgi:hypothetical protein
MVAGGKCYRKLTLDGGPWDDLYEAQLGSEGSKNEQKFLRELYEFSQGMYWFPPVTPPSAAEIGLDLTNPDVVGVKRLLDRVRTAEGDDRVITGTLDATDLAKDQTMIGKFARLHPLPTKAKALPFRATLDVKDRIATLNLMPASPNSWVLQLMDYDTVKALIPPPASEVKTPLPSVQKAMRRSNPSVFA